MILAAATTVAASQHCQRRPSSKLARWHNGKRVGQEALWQSSDTQHSTTAMEGQPYFSILLLFADQASAFAVHNVHNCNAAA